MRMKFSILKPFKKKVGSRRLGITTIFAPVDYLAFYPSPLNKQKDAGDVK
jgi:hypothetical protein